MKHSSSGSMSETSEAKVPCSGNWDAVLKKLYVDLFNLIVESRIPGVNERGYGDGMHCPPLLGPNVHLCDLSKPECQKHQRLIYHLLRAVRHNVFEIEVLMLPDCCSESKLKERIQNKEYILLERWSMKCMHGKPQPAIEVPELLRAIRSFLHFSQISAWLSLTKGKSPLNIYYWVKPTTEPSLTQFESIPEVHSFPVCKISDSLLGIVNVNYPTRKQYIPIIPCSKHPPHRELTFRTIKEDSTLTQTIPLNSQLVKQLHKTCDNQQTLLTVKHCATDPEPLSVLKTVAQNGDGPKPNKILKHSKSQITSQNTSVTKCASQENMCSSNPVISRTETTLNILNKVLMPSICDLKSTSIEVSPEQTVTTCLDMPSNSELCIISPNLLIRTVDASQTATDTLFSQSLLNIQQKNSLKSLKRKREDFQVHIIPNKKRKRLLNEAIKNCTETEPPQENTFKKGRKRRHSLISSNKSPKLMSTDQKIKNDANRRISNELNSDISSTNALKPVQSALLYSNHIFCQSLQSEEMQCNVRSTTEANCESNSFDLFDSNQNGCSNRVLNKTCTKNTLKSRCSKLLFKADPKQNQSTITGILESESESPSQLLINSKELDKNHKLLMIDNVMSCNLQCAETGKYNFYQDNNVLNILDNCNNTALPKHLYIKKSSKIISPKLKQFKLRKHFSKTFYKSKKYLKNLGLQNFSNCNISKLLPIHLLNENKTLNMDFIDTDIAIKNSLLSKKHSIDPSDYLTDKNYVKKSCTKPSCLKCQKSNREIKESRELPQRCPAWTDEQQAVKYDDCPSVKRIAETTINCCKDTSQDIQRGEKSSSECKNKKIDYCNVLHQKATPYLDCFPKHKLKFTRGRKLLGNFEESILKGCLPPVSNVKGFHIEIGASGSFCPNHITLPADVSFYDLDSPHSGTTPYMANVTLSDTEYCLPKKGAVQVTLFNPSDTVVKMFVLNYDLSDMPPMCHTFMRQKTYFMPIGSTAECPSSQKWLRFIIHLRFASSKTGKVYLHKDIKIVVLNKSNDDAASEFSQEPRELRSFLHVPTNPRFSNI